MNISSLISAVIVASLLIGNVACACAKVGSEISSGAHHQHDSHHQHHAANDAHQADAHQADAHQAPCDHQDCDSCTSLENSCTSKAYDAVYKDRETRLHPIQKNDGLDGPDPEYAAIDTGQPRATPPRVVLRNSYQPPPFLLADTPIQRKDRLTE